MLKTTDTENCSNPVFQSDLKNKTLATIQEAAAPNIIRYHTKITW